MLNSHIKDASAFLLNKVRDIDAEIPSLALTLGSGLGAFGAKLDALITIPYEDIPHFPHSTVEGHQGALILARDEKTKHTFWIMQGRVHFYEGYSMETVTFPIRVFAKAGVKKLLLTNAAGGVNKSFTSGDLMLIEDHLNLFGTNPLIGKNLDEFGTRFPDMSSAYNQELSHIIKKEAGKLSIDLKQGVYAGMSGPSFETPAEIKMLAVLGADAVGMSTVPEVIVANHSGVSVAGISFISNAAAGISETPLTHEEVTENAGKVEKKFSELMVCVVQTILGA